MYKGEMYGTGSGEGPSLGQAPVHHVKILDHRHDQVVDVDVPEDRCDCHDTIAETVCAGRCWGPVAFTCSVP